MRDFGGPSEGFLRRRRIPEIAFEIDDLRRRDHIGIDIGRRQVLAGAEVGVHRALAIRRHQDHRTRCGSPVFEGGRRELHADRPDIMPEDVAKVVIRDLADEGRALAERGHAGRRIAGTPA
jgi:hypothetical protein